MKRGPVVIKKKNAFQVQLSRFHTVHQLNNVGGVGYICADT